MSEQRLICRYTEGSTDEPSCPKCGGYNAMLHDSDPYQGFPTWEFKKTDFRKCRDCGQLAVRID